MNNSNNNTNNINNEAMNSFALGAAPNVVPQQPVSPNTGMGPTPIGEPVNPTPTPQAPMPSAPVAPVPPVAPNPVNAAPISPKPSNATEPFGVNNVNPMPNAVGTEVPNPTPINPTPTPQALAPNAPVASIPPVGPNPVDATPVSPQPMPNIDVTLSTSDNLGPVEPNSTPNANINDDDELLKAFIGKNYEKITTNPFNIAGFFFTSFYMFYRKMFLYGILLFIVNLIISNFLIKNSLVVSILLGLVVGFLINKVYLYYAKKKINKIKIANSQKSIEELKNICATKGGTSVGQIFLGFLAQFGIALVTILIMMLMGISTMLGDLLNPENWDITINGHKVNISDDNNTNNNDNNNSPSNTGTLVENVFVSGYSCFGSACTISINDSNDVTTDYTMNYNDELFKNIGDYKDYVKVDIYYDSNGNEKTITSYKLYLKSNNEDISSIKTENELREKIGLYTLGTHTDTLTLKEIGTTGFGYGDYASYTYTNYTFVDSKNIEYEMKYINSNGTLNLTEGNKYTVTFEVVEGTFNYEFNIKSVS